MPANFNFNLSDHIMTITGYFYKKDELYFIIKNSWGKDHLYLNGGYFYLNSKEFDELLNSTHTNGRGDKKSMLGVYIYGPKYITLDAST